MQKAMLTLTASN